MVATPTRCELCLKKELLFPVPCPNCNSRRSVQFLCASCKSMTQGSKGAICVECLPAEEELNDKWEESSDDDE